MSESRFLGEIFKKMEQSQSFGSQGVNCLFRLLVFVTKHLADQSFIVFSGDYLLQRGENAVLALSGHIKGSCSPVYPASSGGFNWMPGGESEQSKPVVLPPVLFKPPAIFTSGTS